MQNTISIIIPVYNRPNSILKVLESIEQSFIKNVLEVIIVDDSNDKTSENIKQYKGNSNLLNIIHIKPPVRAGVSRSRNIGINQATGDIVVFVDSDDLLLKGSIQRIINAFDRENELVIYFGSVIYKSGKTKKFLDKYFLENGDFIDFVRTATQPEMLTAIKIEKGKKNFYKFNPELSGFENLLFLKVLKNGGLFFRDKALTRFYDDMGLDRLSFSNPRNYQNMRNGFIEFFSKYGYEFLRYNTKIFFMYLAKLIIYNRLIDGRRLTDIDNLIGIITLPLPKIFIKKAISFYIKHS